MTRSLSYKKIIAGIALAAAFASGIAVSLAAPAFADSPAVIFLTRLNQVIATYPLNNAFSVGSTTASTPNGGKAKLQVVLGYTGYLNGTATTTYQDAFDVASTTANGSATTTADLLRINNAGCVNIFATSTATQVKLTFNATTTQGSTNNGVVDFAYGTCTP